MGSFLIPGLVPRKAVRASHGPDFPWVLGEGAKTSVLGNNRERQKPGVGWVWHPVERGRLAPGQAFRDARGPHAAPPQPKLQALKTHPSGTPTVPVSLHLCLSCWFAQSPCSPPVSKGTSGAHR